MTAIHKLQAAIARLESLDESAESSGWAVDDESGEFEVYGSQGGTVAVFEYRETAELVAALRETVKPQIALLRLALYGPLTPSEGSRLFVESANKLASAILGVSDADVG